MTVLRIHAHKARTKERLNVSYRINWRHNRIHIAIIREDSHLCLRMECLIDILFGISCLVHYTIAFTLSNRALQDILNLLLRQVFSERGIGLMSVLTIKRRLQVLRHMVEHRFFSILLHTRIDCGEDLQSICIQIILLTVLAEVLITPSIKRIGVPSNRVKHELPMIPLRVFIRLGALCHHIQAEELSEIRCGTVFMIYLPEVQLHFFFRIGIPLGSCQISRFLHLRQHHIAPLGATLLIANRVIERRVFAQSYQRCSLCH